MINASDMKRGVILELDGDPWLVIDCAFQTPSAPPSLGPSANPTTAAQRPVPAANFSSDARTSPMKPGLNTRSSGG